MNDFSIIHHGAIHGVTGSCHELRLADGRSLLVDCGLFQGEEVSGTGATAEQLAIDFPIDGVVALVFTHVHIDHVGRLPWLLAAGFRGPILCSEASVLLLPLILEDALKVGVTRDSRLIGQFLRQIKQQLIALPYKQWHSIADDWRINLHPAGHILGSAFIETRLEGKLAPMAHDGEWRIIFSGDLGAPYTPLLPAPRSPYRADILILESTYGDRYHTGRAERRRQLRSVIEGALRNRGTVLIPAFSIGRTQELLYELEGLIARYGNQSVGDGISWNDLEIIVDSPLAARITTAYHELRHMWDAEALRRIARGRHPLAFEQLLTIDSHEDHLRTVEYLAKSGRPTVVIAASGMCAGGRVVNYLKAMLEDDRHDVLFVGYQATGTPGRMIQEYGPRGGYVELEGRRYSIRAKVHTLSGYSAHADQGDLIRFVTRMRQRPHTIYLVHGDRNAKQVLRQALQERCPEITVVIPD